MLVPLSVFIAVGGLLSYWQIALRAPAIGYGDAKATHFSKQVAEPGENISLCFDTVTWYRLCPAELVTTLHPPATVKATRFDLPVHRISTPLKTGPIEAKCRPFQVPHGLAAGTWTLRGYARAECAPLGSWAPVTTDLSPVPLVIRPAGG